MKTTRNSIVCTVNDTSSLTFVIFLSSGVERQINGF